MTDIVEKEVKSNRAWREECQSLRQKLTECTAREKEANESLTVAYMSGFHDGKKKGGREALLEAIAECEKQEKTNIAAGRGSTHLPAINTLRRKAGGLK